MNSRGQLKTFLLAVFPVIILGAIVASFLSGGPTKIFETEIPPVEEIHVMRHTLSEDLIILDVMNIGTDPVTIAQVMVRGAFWNHSVSPKRNLQPLESARVNIPFPWNIGEPIGIVLLTSTGLPFDYEIEVASNTPTLTRQSIVRFAMIGIYVGVIPVALGICWFPFLRRLRKTALDFITYVTVGLLAFLTIDALHEAGEVVEHLPGVLNGTALIVLGIMGTIFILLGIEKRNKAQANGGDNNVAIAWLVAFAIGLHNLGEGLAIGSAYVLGEMTLGAMLVIGFTIHNATEGIAIVTPILKERINIKRLVFLGALGGVPTIFGCWIGAFTYSPLWSILFLGIGVGALIQVIIIILSRRTRNEIFQPINVLGLLTGYLIMYGTGILVGGS